LRMKLAIVSRSYVGEHLRWHERRIQELEEGEGESAFPHDNLMTALSLTASDVPLKCK